MNDASNFIQKLMEVIDKVALVKKFDSEISENLIIRDKLLRNTKQLASCR